MLLWFSSSSSLNAYWMSIILFSWESYEWQLSLKRLDYFSALCKWFDPSLRDPILRKPRRSFPWQTRGWATDAMDTHTVQVWLQLVRKTFVFSISEFVKFKMCSILAWTICRFVVCWLRMSASNSETRVRWQRFPESGGPDLARVAVGAACQALRPAAESAVCLFLSPCL